MKICALVLLLACCVFQNASADWRNDVKINHMQHINSIVNDTLSRISKDVSAKGNTPAGKQCYEQARLSLRSASQNGYSAVSRCVSQANNAGEANVCAQQADAEVFEVSLEVSRTARQCLENA